MLRHSFDSQCGRYRYRRVGFIGFDRLVYWRMLSRWSKGHGDIEWVFVKDAYIPQSYTRAQVMAKFRDTPG